MQREVLTKELEPKMVDVPDSLQVILDGGDGLGRSVVLNARGRRYIFNCGEGFGRTFLNCVDSGKHLSDGVFFTQVNWNNFGGVLEHLLNTREYGRGDITLHCSENVGQVLKLQVQFNETNKLGVKLTFRDITEGKFEDGIVTVDPIMLEKKATESENDKPQTKVTETGEHVPYDNGTRVTAYIVQTALYEKPRVVVDKLVELGVKSGPWVGELVRGKTVTLENGRVVRPEEVCEVLETKGPVVVVECPSVDYLDSLLESEKLAELGNDAGKRPSIIIHMSSSHVIKDPRYKTFMDRYQEGTVHFMLNENSPGPHIPRCDMLQKVHNHISPDLFPLLHQQDWPEMTHKGNIYQGETGLTYTLKKKPGQEHHVKWTRTGPYNFEQNLEALKQVNKQAENKLMQFLYDEYHDTLYENMKKSSFEREVEILHQHPEVKGTPLDETEYPEIVFLGTSSAQASGHRNTTCILVQLRKDEYMILDCGCGSLKQMMTLYGPEKTEHIMANLKAIFISHMHLDHHMGLYGFLEAHGRALEKQQKRSRLLLLAPEFFSKWLHCYAKVSKMENVSPKYIPHQWLLQEGSANLRSLAEGQINAQFLPIIAHHDKHAYGCAITHKDGWKLVYSGDTVPCETMVNGGKNCDILIHEGTFDDYYVHESVRKKHSTTGDAILAGRKMGAKFTILTHFSARSIMPEITPNFTDNVGFTFDFLQVRPSQLKLLPLLNPAFNQLYLYGQLVNKLKRLHNRSVDQKQNAAYNEYCHKAETEKAKRKGFSVNRALHEAKKLKR